MVETQLGQEEHPQGLLSAPPKNSPFCPSVFLDISLSRLLEGLEDSCLRWPRAGEPPSLLHALASLPEWGGRVFLHTMSRTAVPPRGVATGPRTVLFLLSGAHTHHR